jgi:hypothetical protein
MGAALAPIHKGWAQRRRGAAGLVRGKPLFHFHFQIVIGLQALDGLLA